MLYLLLFIVVVLFGTTINYSDGESETSLLSGTIVCKQKRKILFEYNNLACMWYYLKFTSDMWSGHSNKRSPLARTN